MNARFFITIFMMLLSAGLVAGTENHEQEISEGKQLIASGANCNQLTDEQLEHVGDYLMEQMHPGKAHEMMDKMMGGEGSESLKHMHIQMARRIYCNQDVGGLMDRGMTNRMGSGGMMPMIQMMRGRTGGRRMAMQNMMGSGMMGSWAGSWGFGGVLWTIIVIGLAVLVWLWIIKLWRELFQKKR